MATRYGPTLRTDGTTSLSHFSELSRSIEMGRSAVFHVPQKTHQRQKRLSIDPGEKTKDEGNLDDSSGPKKLQIGDLSSLGINKKKQKWSKENTSSNLPTNEVRRASFAAEQSQTFQSDDFAPVEKYNPPQYNRDPINDPVYERRASDDVRRPGVTASTAADNFNLRQRSEVTFVGYRSSGIRKESEKAFLVKTNRKLSIDTTACRPRHHVTISEKKNVVKVLGKESVDGGSVRGRNPAKSSRRTSVVSSEAKRRSRSEPPVPRPTNTESDLASSLLIENSNESRVKSSKMEERDYSRRRSSSFLVPVPMKVTSFTSSGDEITQEYFFLNKFHDGNFLKQAYPDRGKACKTESNKKTSKEMHLKYGDKLEKAKATFSKLERKSSDFPSTAKQHKGRGKVKSPDEEDQEQPFTEAPVGERFNPTLETKSSGKHPKSESFHLDSERFPRRTARPSFSAPSSPTMLAKKPRKSEFSRKAKREKCPSAGNSPQTASSGSQESLNSLSHHINHTHSPSLLEQEFSPNQENIKSTQRENKSLQVDDVTRKPQATSRSSSDPTTSKGPQMRKGNQAVYNNNTLPRNRRLHGQIVDLTNWDIQDSENRRRSDTVVNAYDTQGKEPLYENGERIQTNGVPVTIQESPSEPAVRPTARRAAVVSTLPDSDLSVLSDTIANLQRNQPIALSTQLKRSKWNFPKLNFMTKDKDREQKLEDVLMSWKANKPDEAIDAILQEIKSCKKSNKCASEVNGNNRERKRHDAVWELFSSERTYLLNHLLVLRQVFMEPLQELQCEGFLLTVDVRSLFGNLEELCKVSLDFCHALLKVVGNKHPGDFGCADSIDIAFENFDKTICPPYQRYFSGYRNSLTDREDLKSNEDYLIFMKWCERNPRCQRLKLNDFLVSPMQRLTKFPLLLRNIAAYTADQSQTASIFKTLSAVQESLKALEGKVTWLNHFQFLQDLQNSISWPPVYEIDTKTVLPESLRNALSHQTCKNIIANPNRRLILEGPLSVIENGKPIELYAFLFDDMLLLTKPKKGKRKTSEVPSSLKRHSLLKDGTVLSVHRQPIALDRFMVYDVDVDNVTSMGIKRAFVLVQENRFQQMCAITMLQAPSEDAKRSWLTQLASTAAQWMEKNVYSGENTTMNSPVVKRNNRLAKNSESFQRTTGKQRTAFASATSKTSDGQSSNNDSESSRRSSSTSDTKNDVYSSDTCESV
ncbi:uncharacterized protein LOC143460765 [Clavelina lepadiformis]|uniref:uncharacterized protein LOC143460765 n=1 Tax=Clavelina lepadiformis TaxID=159417 RepID=UPI004041AE43